MVEFDKFKLRIFQGFQFKFNRTRKDKLGYKLESIRITREHKA